jgi:hypothetical protein
MARSQLLDRNMHWTRLLPAEYIERMIEYNKLGESVFHKGTMCAARRPAAATPY